MRTEHINKNSNHDLNAYFIKPILAIIIIVSFNTARRVGYVSNNCGNTPRFCTPGLGP